MIRRRSLSPSARETLDEEYRRYHTDLVNLIPADGEEALTRELDALDAHDDEICLLTAEIERLIAACGSVPDPHALKVTIRQLARIKKNLEQIQEEIRSMDGKADDVCLVQHYEEQVLDIKREMKDVFTSLLSMDISSDHAINKELGRLEKEVSQCSLSIRRLIGSSSMKTHSVPPTIDASGVKLPKLDVPTFDGNLLKWKSFWEQFCISVHDRSSLSKAEKLVYFQQSLMGGAAKSLIDGLSQTGDHYDEAVQSLTSRYNRPRLIHQAHVRVILETPSLKDGTGKELRQLHDSVQQHLRALKSMGHAPSGSFVTSILELKLDPNTLFEWQKHSQSSADVPHYQDLLDFLNLRAQASELSVPDRKPKKDLHASKRPHQPGNIFNSYLTNTLESGVNSCVICKTDKHPLYGCTKFKSLSHDRMLSTVKEHNLCMNCLKPGHFSRQCPSINAGSASAATTHFYMLNPLMETPRTRIDRLLRRMPQQA